MRYIFNEKTLECLSMIYINLDDIESVSIDLIIEDHKLATKLGKRLAAIDAQLNLLMCNLSAYDVQVRELEYAIEIEK